MRQPLLVLVLLAAPLLAGSSVGDDAEPVAAVKAAFLFRFAGYVDWPVERGTRERFEFAIVGNEEVAAELRRRLPGRSVNGRATVVRELARLQDAAAADLVYVGPGHAARLPQVQPRLHGALVVTDEERGLEVGATINFVHVADRVRFEVSLPAARRAGLRLRAGLLSVAARVEGREERPVR